MFGVIGMFQVDIGPVGPRGVRRQKVTCMSTGRVIGIWNQVDVVTPAQIMKRIASSRKLTMAFSQEAAMQHQTAPHIN